MKKGDDLYDLSAFDDIQIKHIYPLGLRVGMLVKIVCYADCVFPILGVDVGILTLEAACGYPSDMVWGIACGPMESITGMVVKVHHPERGEKNPVVEVLLHEEIVIIDEDQMAHFPYSTLRGHWRMMEIHEE